MDAIPAIAGLLGRARKRPAKLHADKGYDYKRCRAYLRQRGVASRIAAKSWAYIAGSWREHPDSLQALASCAFALKGDWTSMKRC